MTKGEFGEQFKRLRIAGYRLPVFDGVKITEVIDEWYQTFQGCTASEFAEAVDRLKQAKTDTWWPATGELWTHIFEARKERRIRRQTHETGGTWQMSDEDSQEFLALLRAAKDKILGRMAMPNVEPQVEPPHITEAREERARQAAEEAS